jgi:hypothetical protein
MIDLDSSQSIEVSKIKIKIRKNVFLIFIFGTSRDCGRIFID